MSSGGSSLLGALQDAVQSEFFASAEELDALADEKGRLPKDALRQIRQQRGRGRPPGARNQRNAKLAKLFVQKYGDPIDVLGEIMTMPTDILYQQMILAQGGESKNKRVTGKDAFDMRMAAAKEILPYIHGKQPIAVEVTGKADAVLFIPGLNAPANFSREQLTTAAEKLGAAAIEANGIRLDDGTLIEDGAWFDVPQPDDDSAGDTDAG